MHFCLFVDAPDGPMAVLHSLPPSALHSNATVHSQLSMMTGQVNRVLSSLTMTPCRSSQLDAELTSSWNAWKSSSELSRRLRVAGGASLRMGCVLPSGHTHGGGGL